MKKILWLYSYALIASFYVHTLAFAQNTPAAKPGGQSTPVAQPGGQSTPVAPNPASQPPVTINNPLGNKSLLDFLQDLLNAVMVLAVPIIVFFIILAGFKYVTARGNPSKIEEAHKALLYTLLGGVLILGAKVILTVIQGTVESFAG